MFDSPLRPACLYAGGTSWCRERSDNVWGKGQGNTPDFSIEWRGWGGNTEQHNTKTKPKQYKISAKKRERKESNSAGTIQSVLQLTLFTVQLISCFHPFVWTFNQLLTEFICVLSCTGFIWVWTDFIKSLQAGYFYCSLNHFYFCLL